MKKIIQHQQGVDDIKKDLQVKVENQQQAVVEDIKKDLQVKVANQHQQNHLQANLQGTHQIEVVAEAVAAAVS